MTSRRILILGALSAVAEQAARLFAAEGAQILLVGRHEDRLGAVAADLRNRGAVDVQHAALDLAAADPAMETPRLVERLGGLDVALVAYGVLGDQGRAEQDLAHAAMIIDTDFRSAAFWCLALAGVLERQRSGTLLVIGSVAGDRGRLSNYVYGAAKGGLAILVEGLAHRLSHCGARAVLIKPGFIDTPMTAHFTKGALWSTPSHIGRIIHRASARGGPIVYAPGWWRLVMLMVRQIPAFVFHRSNL